MRWIGKVVGISIGLLLFGGIMSAIVGLVLGHLFDRGLFDGLLRDFGINRKAPKNTVKDIFFNSTFMVMGFLAKSDGRVSEAEIRAARQVMRTMSLDRPAIERAIFLFDQGKSGDFDLELTMQQLRKSCWMHPSLLQTFLQIQMQIAYAGGKITPGKQEALQQVCAHLGISQQHFERFNRQNRAGQHYRQQHQRQHHNPRAHLREAYQILGMSASDSDADVKKAYRRLMSQNHPDKLISKGVPPEMIKIATEKTQQIKAAYDAVSAARGT